MSLRAKAEENVNHFFDELMNGLSNDQHNILREMPRGGHTYLRMLEVHERRLRQLADRCKQQFEWVDRQPDTLKDWSHGKGWEDFSASKVKELYGAMNLRLNAFVSALSGSTLHLSEVQGRLYDIHTDVQTKLRDALDALILESEGYARAKRKEWWLTHSTSLLGQLFTGVISLVVGIVVGLSVEHFKSDVTKSSSCPSGSTVLSNSRAQTPQAPGARALSVALREDPHYTAQHVPATPSSTRRP